ncbi:MAG: hypothetical protein ACM3KM_00455 [Acidobacteriaceae bacterium]
MFNKISSLVLAGLLFAVLTGSKNHISLLALSLGVLVLATFVVNIKRIGLSWPHLLLPVLFLLGCGLIYMIIDSPTLRLLFLLASSVSFYLLESKLGKESHLLQNFYLFSVLSIFVGIFALDFYLDLSTIWVVGLVFLASFLLSIQGFAGFSLPAKKFFYLMIAIVLSQAAWGLSVWPTHYVVDAVVLFCLFYLLWTFSFSAFFGKLTVKKIYLQVSLVVIVLILTLSTAAWRPLVH